MSCVLEIQGLGKSYNGVNILKDFDLKLIRGEVLSILGPSGCGKSTLLRLIAGLEQPEEGSIRVEAEHGNTGKAFMIFQDFDQLFPWRTVLDNVIYPMGIRKIYASDKERNEAALEMLDMVEYKDSISKYPHQLSGGMKQKVALARALCLNPDLLLMDEPFASLDAQTRNSMQELLLRIWKRKGLTILFVTHDIYEALAISDRILVMGNKGEGIKTRMELEGAKPRNYGSPELMKLWKEIYELL